VSQNTTSSGGGFLSSGLTILFVYLKMTNQVSWSWWWVLSPIWCLSGLAAVFILVGFLWAWYDS
jgi:hypothetical protein